jgi:hypothetical protein
MLKLSFLILAIIFVAGCVGQSPTTPFGANGLVIKNVYIDPPEDQIQPGDIVTVTADVENLGSATARNVVAEIVGASWLADPSLTAQYPGNIILANFYYDEDGDGNPGVTLTAPDPRYRLPGGTKTVNFRFPSPRLPEGQHATFDLKLRIKYDYETSAVAQIPAYSRERYNTLYQQKKLTPPATTIIPVQTSQNVPVTISMTGPDKLVVGRPYEEYTYQLTFSNAGTSVPITTSPVTHKPEDGLIMGTLWITGPGVFWKQCLGVSPERLLGGVPSNIDNFFGDLQFKYEDKFSAWYQTTPWSEAWGVSMKVGSVFFGANTYQSNAPQYSVYGTVAAPEEPKILWPAFILFPNAIDWEIFPLLMETIKLRRGQTVTKSCTLGIINDPEYQQSWGGRSDDTVLINAHLKYRYFSDQDLKITVSAPAVG